MHAMNKITVVFRNDDPSACSQLDHEQRIAAVFERYGFPQTIGVVPMRCQGDPHDPKPQRFVGLQENRPMVDFLRDYAARSHSEIALHGYSHQNNPLSRPDRRENYEFSGLDFRQQHEMIGRGTQIITTALGVRPTTFIPPWNRLDRNTVKACISHRYRLISSGPHTPVYNGIAALGMNCELANFAELLGSARTADHHVLLVLTYHSRFVTPQKDLDLLEQALRLCSETPNLEVLTLAETAQRYPDLVRTANSAAANSVAQWQIPGTVRARTRLYRTALRRLGIKTKLDRTYTEARNLYAAGQYSAAADLTNLIDRLCRRLLTSARLTLFLAAAVVATAVWLITSLKMGTYRLYPFTVLLPLPIVAAALLKRRMTNIDMINETRNAAMLIAAGALAAVTIAETAVLIAS